LLKWKCLSPAGLSLACCHEISLRLGLLKCKARSPRKDKWQYRDPEFLGKESAFSNRKNFIERFGEEK
jgi:hypothetical protein